MTFRRFQNIRGTQDGKAWNPNDGSGQYKWYNSDGDQAITVGEYIVFRTFINIPKNSVIQSATFGTEYIVKDGNSIPQSFSYNAYMERYSPAYPEANDSYIGPLGTFPPQPRIRAGAVTVGTLTYSVNTPGADYLYIDVTAQVQEIVNHSEYVPGQPVSVIIQPTAESGDISLRMSNHEFAAKHPAIDVEYTEPFSSDLRYDVNLHMNSSVEQDLEGWGFGDAFGFFVAGQGAVKSSEQFRSGSYSMKVTSGATDGNKSFGATGVIKSTPGIAYVMSGWVWIPASLPRGLISHWLYRGIVGDVINTREQWVPFSTPPCITNDFENLFPVISMDGPTDASYYFYVDDVTYIESRIPQMSFNNYTLDNNLKTHIAPPGDDNLKGNSVRVTRARSQAFTSLLKVLDNCDTTSTWTQTSHGGSGVTFSLAGGGVVSTIAPNLSPLSPVTVKLTSTMTRSKRFLGVNYVQTGGANPVLTKVVRSVGPDIINPVVQATDGGRVFYDIPPHGNIVSLEWSATGGTSERTFTIYDISEFEYPASNQTMQPGEKWLKTPQGIWLRSDSERRSVTFGDTEASSGHARAGMTLGDLVATGDTWQEVEAL